jgi:hypothetical protein
MNVLVDFYRCPERDTRFQVAGDLSPTADYFRFGDAVCYGQSSVGSIRPCINALPDLSQAHDTEGSIVTLPFDPSQIVDNLRLERYAGHGLASKQRLSKSAIRKLYYSLRPLLGVPIRKHLQKIFLGNWEALSFPSWPVDCSVESIFERLLALSMKARGIERIPFIWFWPHGAASCVIMTHDVETKAGLNFVPQLMDLDDEFGVKASFQVIPQTRYSVPARSLQEIRDRGFELNVQDLNHDGNLFEDRELFLDYAQSINRYLHEYGAHGFRAGRMYRNADWYEALDISYDMSVPNVAHLEPQRGGCCTVFPYFIGDILELPLTTAQDYSLFHILGTYSTGLWKKQLGLIGKKSGLASFIIHPDYIREKRALVVYKDLLTHLSVLREDGKVWMPLPRDLNRWWRQRSKMSLVRLGDTWEIEAPGSEQARLAYASLEGDRVVYTVEQQGYEYAALRPRGATGAVNMRFSKGQVI